MSRASTIEQTAAEWIAREDGEAWSVADAAARDAWLAEATENRIAYLRLKSVWQRADRLAALKTAGARRGSAPARLVSWQALAAALALFAIGAGALFAITRVPGSTYQTVVGAHETVHLADGSTLELNTDTRLHALVTGEKREVVLDKGEAFFAIVHDAKRPFVVIAGDRRIVDLGTKFSVRRDGDNVQVIVTEGRVRIDDLSGKSAAPPVVARSDVQVVAGGDATLVAMRTPQQIVNALSWRSGLLVFNQQTLAEAAAEFNRYNEKKLVIADPKIGQTRIGGSFEAANVEAFARLLHEGFGYRIEETDDAVEVSE